MEKKEKKPLMEKKDKKTLFQPGNKLGGRPQGSRNKLTLALDELGSGNGMTLYKQIIQQALAGCLQSQKVLIDRIYPVPKYKSYIDTTAIKGMVTQTHINEAMTQVLTEIGDAEMSLEDGVEVTKLIDAKAGSIQRCMHDELELIRNQLTEIQGK